MRILLTLGLFAAVLAAGLNADLTGQQPGPKTKQPNYDPPKTVKPNEGTLKEISEKTERLRKAIEGLKSKKVDNDVLIEVEIYLKAAENIVRFEEWYSDSSGKWAIQTLDQGLERAKLAESWELPWRNAPGKCVVRAYRSRVDDSIQPYAVLLPHDYGNDRKKKWRLDIVLHGRDSALTESKFIASHGTAAKAAPKDLDYIQLEVYGRGNNAYRWAGEQDVFEAAENFMDTEEQRNRTLTIDPMHIVLRGFSMGGAGTWHLGLHHPFQFAVIGPGAGFTTTHGYVGGMPRELPDYQEKCLRIYDAVDYAENAFDVPVVAYSGSKDPQKAAADNIETALKGFKEPLRFTHLVAPGLEHQMPKEWQDKAEVEYRKHVANRPEFSEKNRKLPDHVRFVTYTTRYNVFVHGLIRALDEHYKKAVIDSHWNKDEVKISTENIALIELVGEVRPIPDTVVIDGQKLVAAKPVKGDRDRLLLEKVAGQWKIAGKTLNASQLRKTGGDHHWLQGPIDDAFTMPFKVVVPSGEGWHPATDKYTAAAKDRFAAEWDRYFRGKLPTAKGDQVDKWLNLVLFGDPESNPLIAKVLPKLPITWTREKLVVNGVEYDAKTHIPVLIYPNPLNPGWYVVLNSGHTFHEADFKGTNALLYLCLGDWAVIKPTPTAKDPAAYEVVAAGLFDENWQFPNKK